MGVRKVPEKGDLRCLRQASLKTLRILFLPATKNTAHGQPAIPLMEESLSFGVMAKTEYLGAARGLTLHGGVNGKHLILPWKGQKAEVLKVMRAWGEDEGEEKIWGGEG